MPLPFLDLQWRFLHHLGAAVVAPGATFHCFGRALHFELPRETVALRFQIPDSCRKRSHFSLPFFSSSTLAMIKPLRAFSSRPGLPVVLGLAMQDLAETSSLAPLCRPANHSSTRLVVIDNRHAEVIEINWRPHACERWTISHEIPNREIVRQTIVNLNCPTRRHATQPPWFPIIPRRRRAQKRPVSCCFNAHGVCAEPREKIPLRISATALYDIKFISMIRPIFRNR
jgi:hypothetical protein